MLSFFISAKSMYFVRAVYNSGQIPYSSKRFSAFKIVFILLPFALLLSACKKDNSGDAITGKWTLSYQISFSSPDSSGAIFYASSTPNYNNDTFNITFSKGNYMCRFPGMYYFINNSLQTVWSDENGYYTIHDNVLDISTGSSASLHQFLHLGFPVGVQSTTVFKKLQPDKLLIVSTYGKMNVNPFGYDSTILISH